MYIIDDIMKKTVKWGVCLLLVAAAAMTLVYRLMNQLPSADLPANIQVLEIFEDGGCLSCHSADPKVPFYAKMPVAGDIVMKDIDSGYRAFDVEPFMEALAVDGEVGQVDLAKIEKVVLDGRMPMPKYYLVHWGSSLTKAKRDVVLSWVNGRRTEMYDDGLAGVRSTSILRWMRQRWLSDMHFIMIPVCLWTIPFHVRPAMPLRPPVWTTISIPTE